MRGQTPHGGVLSCFRGGREAHLGVQDMTPVGPSTGGGGDTAPGPELGKGTGLVLGITGLVLGCTGLVLGRTLALSRGTGTCLLGSRAPPGGRCRWRAGGAVGQGPRGYIRSFFLSFIHPFTHSFIHSSIQCRVPPARGGRGGPHTFVAVRGGPGGGPGCVSPHSPALLLGWTLGSAAPFNCC